VLAVGRRILAGHFRLASHAPFPQSLILDGRQLLVPGIKVSGAPSRKPVRRAIDALLGGPQLIQGTAEPLVAA